MSNNFEYKCTYKENFGEPEVKLSVTHNGYQWWSITIPSEKVFEVAENLLVTRYQEKNIKREV